MKKSSLKIIILLSLGFLLLGCQTVAHKVKTLASMDNKVLCIYATDKDYTNRNWSTWDVIWTKDSFYQKHIIIKSMIKSARNFIDPLSLNLFLNKFEIFTSSEVIPTFASITIRIILALSIHL